jgi:hypothetical protein
MVNKDIFQVGLFCFSVFLLFSIIYLVMTTGDNVRNREKLARSLFIGTGIIGLDLLCCVPLSQPIAPNFIIPYMFPLAVVLTIGSFLFLDYHFSRGIAGLLILFVIFNLSNIWAFSNPEGSVFVMVFSFLTMVLGVLALFLSAKPYLLRDCFRRAASSRVFKLSLSSFLVIYMIFSVVVALNLN